MKLPSKRGSVIVIGLMGLGVQTLKTHNRTEFSWRNNVYNAKLSLKTRLEHGFCHRMRVLSLIITVCTLLSLLQLIKRFKLHVGQKR